MSRRDLARRDGFDELSPALGRLDEDAVRAALDDDPEIAGAAQLGRLRRQGDDEREQEPAKGHGMSPRFRRSASHSASSGAISNAQGGIGVPGTPLRMI